MCPYRYEKLKWGPIAPVLLMLAVPLCFDGESLNVWTFSLLYHAIYFRAYLRVVCVAPGDP